MRLRSRPLAVTLALLVSAAAIGVYAVHGQRGAATLLDPGDPDLVARGAALYAQRCATCHGPGLEGEADWRKRRADGTMPAPPHDETGHTWHHPDELLFRLTKFGPAALAGGGYASTMPGFAETMSDAEIVAVLSFIKSAWPAPVVARHDAINERARSR